VLQRTRPISHHATGTRVLLRAHDLNNRIINAARCLANSRGYPWDKFSVGRRVRPWVHDAPLLRYLGAEANQPRFAATKFRRADGVAKLDEIASRPGANDKSRVSALLANAAEEQTLTITHVLWAMFGVLPSGQEQLPHRHQSVALDLILDAEPGCYTLVGARLNERNEIVDPIRVDWQAGGAFVTPPGMWHAHFNESGAPAHLIPIQDAGLQTYLRSLDIRFTNRSDLSAG
jgi:gentisate 1,2-dioxygenase